MGSIGSISCQELPMMWRRKSMLRMPRSWGSFAQRLAPCRKIVTAWMRPAPRERLSWFCVALTLMLIASDNAANAWERHQPNHTQWQSVQRMQASFVRGPFKGPADYCRDYRIRKEREARKKGTPMQGLEGERLQCSRLHCHCIPQGRK